MKGRPRAEALFEQFCEANGIPWQRLPEGATPTPDYRISLGSQSVHVEVKQIDADPDFNPPDGVGTRVVGSHVRQKIADARRQVRVGSSAGCPSALLVYNNLDPLQLFGTEAHDFLAAMYGEMTLLLQHGEIKESFYGRNALLREDQNTSFSAVGHLVDTPNGPQVHLFENAYARIPLAFPSLPTCSRVTRVTIDGGDR